MRFIILLIILDKVLSLNTGDFVYDNTIPHGTYPISYEETRSYFLSLIESESQSDRDIDSVELYDSIGNETKTGYNNTELQNLYKSIDDYYILLKDFEKTGDLDDIDWDTMNREIMEELCEEMKGEIDDICERNTKTFELTIFNNINESVNIDDIIKLSYNDNPYKFS